MWSPRCTLKFKVRPRTSLKNILLCPVGRQSENLAIRHLVKHQLHQFFGVIVSGLSSLGNPDQHLDLVWVNLDQPNALNGLWVGEHRDQLAPHLTGERLTISGIVPRIILISITTATMNSVWRKCSSPVHQASFSSLFFAQWPAIAFEIKFNLEENISCLEPGIGSRSPQTKHLGNNQNSSLLQMFSKITITMFFTLSTFRTRPSSMPPMSRKPHGLQHFNGSSFDHHQNSHFLKR